MPCLTITTKSSRGVVLPVRLTNPFGERSKKISAGLSLLNSDNLISPSLAKVLGLFPLGAVDLSSMGRTIPNVPFYVVNLDLVTGFLGHAPKTQYSIRGLTVYEIDHELTGGVLLGLDFTGMGSLSMTSQSVTFCL